MVCPVLLFCHGWLHISVASSLVKVVKKAQEIDANWPQTMLIKPTEVAS